MKDSSKIIGTIKAKIGSVEITCFISFTILLIISIKQFFKENFNLQWIYLSFLDLILLSLLIAFVNFKSKTIILRKNSITVKRPLRFYSRTYLKEELRGYDLQEYYDNQIGLSRQIRIWTKDNKQIVLIRDAYSDYEKVLMELKKMDLDFLGTVELTNKYKRLIAIALPIITLLTMLMFAASAIIKNMK